MAPLLLLLPTLAMAQVPTGTVLRTSVTTTCAGSPCSGVAPTTNTEGTSISQRRAVAVRLCAAEGQTLSGAGTLTIYAQDEDDGLWSLNPALTIAIPASASGVRCIIALSDQDMLVGYGRVAAVPTAVTLSGGNLTVKYLTRVKVLP